MTLIELYLWDILRTIASILNITLALSCTALFTVSVLFLMFKCTDNYQSIVDKAPLTRPIKIGVIVISILITLSIITPSTEYIDIIMNQTQIKFN